MKKVVISYLMILNFGFLAIACGSEATSDSTENSNVTGQQEADKSKDVSDDKTTDTRVEDKKEETLPKGEVVSDLDKLVGTYAGLHKTSIFVTSPLGGSEEKSNSFAYMLHEIKKVDGKLIALNKVCSLNQAPSLGIQNTFPEAFIDAMGVTTQEITSAGDLLNFEKVVSVVGAKLNDVINDPLPKDASDATQFDADSDGKPGVTILVEGKNGMMKVMVGKQQQMYIAQRVVDHKEAVLSADGSIRGFQLGSSELSTLGASKDMLNMDISARPNPEKSANGFVMKKIETAQDCAYVLGLGESYFK